mgnify:CR=1 FL=1
MSRWKCSYGKSCECNSDLEKSECDLAYIAKSKYARKVLNDTPKRLRNFVMNYGNIRIQIPKEQLKAIEKLNQNKDEQE